VSDVRNLLKEYAVDCVGGFETTATCFGDPLADNERLLENVELLYELGAGKIRVTATNQIRSGR